MIYFQRDLEGKLKDAEQEEETQKAINAAEASINMDQLDEALDIMDKVLRNDPKNGFALMTKARILKRQTLKLKQSDSPDRARLLKQAIVCVDLAIASLPKKDKGEPHYNKACYQALLGPEGLKDDILENLKAAFSLNPALRKSAEEDEDFKLLKDADPDWLKGVDELRKA
jgi:tetratricopeptide (TPR) repeat protein